MFISILHFVICAAMMITAEPSSQFFASHQKISVVFYASCVTGSALSVIALIIAAIGTRQRSSKGEEDKYFYGGDHKALLLIGLASIADTFNGLATVVALTMLTTVGASLGNTVLICLLVVGIVLEALLVLFLVEISITALRLWSTGAGTASLGGDIDQGDPAISTVLGDVETAGSRGALQFSPSQNSKRPKTPQRSVVASARAWITGADQANEKGRAQGQQRGLEF